MKKNFLRLPKKTVDAGERKLARFISAEEWLAMMQADDGTMRQLAAPWQRLVVPTEPAPAPPAAEPSPGIVLSAEEMGDLLKLRVRGKKDTVPEAIPGEIIAYCDDWLLTEGRDSSAGKKRMHQWDWFNQYQWRAKPGYHRLLLPVPGSNNRNWDEQAGDKKKSLLATSFPGWNPASITIATPVVLAWLVKTGKDLLEGVLVRCAERTADGDRASLGVSGGRVGVSSYWDGYPYPFWFLAAAREASENRNSNS